jgi:glutamine amidotransferase
VSRGLGLLPGDVTFLDPQGERLPHIGWNLVTMRRPGRLTEGLGEQAVFYHVHSLACRPMDEADVVGTAEYGSEVFASIVERGNVFGVQFHPEKSSRDGLALLRNFAAVCAGIPA